MAKFFIAFLVIAFVAIAYAAEAEAPTAAKTELTDKDKDKKKVGAKSEVADDLQTAAGGWGFGFPRHGWGGWEAPYHGGWGYNYNYLAKPYPFLAGGWGAPVLGYPNGWGFPARGGWGWADPRYNIGRY